MSLMKELPCCYCGHLNKDEDGKVEIDIAGSLHESLYREEPEEK